MTEVVQMTDVTSDATTDDLDEIVVSRRSWSSASDCTTIAHIPDPQTDDQEPEPLCTQYSNDRVTWRLKDADIYPEGWIEWCGNCLKTADEVFGDE